MTIVALCFAAFALGLIVGCVLSGIERRRYPQPVRGSEWLGQSDVAVGSDADGDFIVIANGTRIRI